MPSRITWLIQDHLILLRNIGQITAEDVQNTDTEILHLLNLSSKPLIHVIIDDRQMDGMPGLKVMMSLQFIRHAHIGWVISHQENPVLRMVGAVVGSAVKLRFRFVKDIHEGLEFLAKVDLTLPQAVELVHRLDEAVSLP